MAVIFLKIDFKLPTNTDNVNVSMLAIANWNIWGASLKDTMEPPNVHVSPNIKYYTLCVGYICSLVGQINDKQREIGCENHILTQQH